MKRRTFLKTCTGAGLALLLDSKASPQISIAELERGFREPPPTARPYTWWHWMNGNITADGITRDLEAMQRVGVGGFQIFQVGTGIPKGPVDYGSPEHMKLLEHAAREALRLGLEFDMHNCPGWSSSGGPWNTPEYAMQQLVWTETYVDGGRRVSLTLPRPPALLNYYRDIAVLACPVPAGERAMHELLSAVRTADGPVDPAQLRSADLAGGIEVRPKSPQEPGVIVLEFREPFEARSIHLWTRTLQGPPGILPPAGAGSRTVMLEASDDGHNFRPVAPVTAREGALGFLAGGLPQLLHATFNPVRARYFRLVFPVTRRVAQIELSGAVRLPDWPAKANFYPGGSFDDRSLKLDVPSEAVIDPQKVVNLTSQMDAQGRLEWDVPPGRWVILRLGHTPTGRQNHPAPDGGLGLECDKYSAAAMDHHFHGFFGPLIETLRPLAEKGLVGALIDSYEVGFQNWTPAFPEEFQKRRGYPLWRYLPAMTGRIVGSPEITERFLWDVRRTQADLMADNYYGRFTELCHKYGWKAYTEPYSGGPFEEMQIGSRVDIPMGEFWHGRGNHRSVKLAASIAHISGKSVVGAESFTGAPPFSKWQEYPYAMKAQGDWMYTQGLNRYIFHRYAHQPHPTAVPGMTMGPWGFHFDRTNTWFEPGRAWLTYVARCQFLLQQGQFVGDLLYFTGESAPGDTPSQNELRPAPPRGYDWDTIHAEALLQRLQIRDGEISLPEGQRYRLLVLTPESQWMTLPVLRKIRDLVRQGMWLLGPKPARTPSLSGYPDSETEFQKLVAEVWGDLDGSSRTERNFGRGRVFWGLSPGEVLSKNGVPPDFEYAAANADADINAIHRRVGDVDIYFVANRRRRPEQVTCTFRVAGKKPQLWDAVTGVIKDAPLYEVAGGRTTIPLQLGPAGSIFVVFRPGAAEPSYRALRRDGQLLFSARPAEQARVEAPQTPVNTFTVSAWVKPEIEAPLPAEGPATGFFRAPSSFLFYPAEGEVLYGSGHACCGLMIGRNGLALFECTKGNPAPVLVAQVPLAGWTHVAVVYRDGTPTLYVNGNAVAQGSRSKSLVHPTVGLPSPRFDVPYLEGEYAALEVTSEALSEGRIKELAAGGLPEPPGPPPVELGLGPSNGFLVWAPGRYELENTAGARNTFVVDSLGEPLEIQGPWTVRFPPNLGAPPEITLAQLGSLHRHPDPGVRYFSGTATYLNRFRLTPEVLGSGRRVFLDLGRVEVIAEVLVNQSNLGILWLPPWRVDITEAVQPGENTLEVRVTNLWPNRLIGDEQLPPENDYGAEGAGARSGFGLAIRRLPDWYVKGQPKPPGGRVTFTTWKHFDKDSPLLESGLLGPVRLRFARVYQWRT